MMTKRKNTMKSNNVVVVQIDKFMKNNASREKKPHPKWIIIIFYNFFFFFGLECHHYINKKYGYFMVTIREWGDKKRKIDNRSNR